jgi:REP-associated tyrosine transposase
LVRPRDHTRVLVRPRPYPHDGQLRKEHRRLVEESIYSGGNEREPDWTERIAVGSKTFVNGVREKLQSKLLGRKVKETGGHFELREQAATYSAHFGRKNVPLSTENALFFDLSAE